MAAKVIETRRALIVVRTYPTPAKKGVEVSCTAAITDSGEWMRIFPVPWRRLDEKEQFRKYEWIEAPVYKASDPRPESYHLSLEGGRRINIVGEISTANAREQRRKVVAPLLGHCMCCLQAKRDQDGFPTLGIFKPKTIQRLRIEEDTPDWSPEQMAILTQEHLWEKRPEKQLEKVPFNFYYDYTCDHADCNGHSMKCTDWEMGQAWRRWRREYGNKWEEAFRNRFETEMIEKYDTHFFVGTIHRHPSRWIIVGLFYPPKARESSGWLF